MQMREHKFEYFLLILGDGRRAPCKAYYLLLFVIVRASTDWNKNQSGAEHQQLSQYSVEWWKWNHNDWMKKCFLSFALGRAHKATGLCVIIDFIIITAIRQRVWFCCFSDFHTRCWTAVWCTESTTVGTKNGTVSHGDFARLGGWEKDVCWKIQSTSFPRKDWVMDLDVGLKAVFICFVIKKWELCFF